MERIDLQDFLKFVRTQEGRVLRTLKRDKPFTVRVTKTGVEYTPQSTMKERPHQTKFMERVLEKFSEKGSYKTTDYQKFTVSSSYTLTLVAAYIAQKEAV
jgi:hypothetical protein